MAILDVLIVILYFVVVIGMGFWYARKAAHSLEDYFLGGKRMHWLALAMSGSVSNFDITGTMWIVSIIFLLGMKSMWHHWMWGIFMGAFFMAYMGKWVRRSKVMTAAEWMKTRFGDGPSGRAARVTYALMAVLTQASFIGYAYQGIGKFASVYIPLEKVADHVSNPMIQNLVTAHESDVLAILTIGITTFYVLLGGLYSVVVTDVIQTVVLTVGSVFIAVLAWSKLTPDMLAKLPEGFTSLKVSWHLPEFAGTENALFEWFGLIVIVWVAKGLLLNAGRPRPNVRLPAIPGGAKRPGRLQNRRGLERVPGGALGHGHGYRIAGIDRFRRRNGLGKGHAPCAARLPAHGCSRAGIGRVAGGVHVHVQFDAE